MKTFCLLVIYNSEREEKTTKENIVKNNVMLIEAPFLIWENYVKSRIKEIHYQVSWALPHLHVLQFCAESRMIFLTLSYHTLVSRSATKPLTLATLVTSWGKLHTNKDDVLALNSFHFVSNRTPIESTAPRWSRVNFHRIFCSGQVRFAGTHFALTSLHRVGNVGACPSRGGVPTCSLPSTRSC